MSGFGSTLNVRLGYQATLFDLSLEEERSFVVEAVEMWETPKDRLAGCRAETNAQRDRKLEEARKQRQVRPRKAA